MDPSMSQINNNSFSKTSPAQYHANGNNIHCFEQSRTIATKACIDILGQVSNKESTPLDCHYHGIPHAWFQISLLKTLVCLASNSQEWVRILQSWFRQWPLRLILRNLCHWHIYVIAICNADNFNFENILQ